MDASLLSLLYIAVFGAALLQAATGIGYGVIAGPIFLVVLNGVEAFQISAIHNILIAVLVAPFVFKNFSGSVMRPLLFGSLIGIPVGFALQLFVGLLVLKCLSAVAVGFVALNLAKSMRTGKASEARSNPSASETGLIGGVSGVMGGMLAMPGPIVASWMSVRGFSKQEIRATILTFAIFVYGSTVLLHALYSGVAAETLRLSLISLPGVIAGVVAGSFVSRYLSETVFQRILLVVLIATVASLLVSVLWPI